MLQPGNHPTSAEVTKPGALTLYAGIRSTLSEGMHPWRGLQAVEVLDDLGALGFQWDFHGIFW
jgi:hypothetical protein